MDCKVPHANIRASLESRRTVRVDGPVFTLWESQKQSSSRRVLSSLVSSPTDRKRIEKR